MQVVHKGHWFEWWWFKKHVEKWVEWCHVMGVPNQSLNLEWNTKNPDLGSVLHQKKCNSGTRKPQILEHQSHQFWSTKNTISGTPRPHFWNIKTRAGFSESQVFFFVVFSILACWMTKSTPSSGWGSCEALGPEAREPFWQRYRRLAHEGAMSLVMKVQIDIIDIAMSAMLPSD